MCRNIKTLSNFEPPASNAEIHASALQFVRKISGTQKPSATNHLAFELALKKVEAATRELVDSLVTNAPAKNRQHEALKARDRNAKRFGAITTN